MGLVEELESGELALGDWGGPADGLSDFGCASGNVVEGGQNAELALG